MGVSNSDSEVGAADGTDGAHVGRAEADDGIDDGHADSAGSADDWAVAADADLVCAPDPDAGDLERRLWDAVDEIPDPHIPVSLVEMGMVYGVRVDGGAVTVEMTYPCLGCPAYDMIQNDVTGRLRAEAGVDEVGVEVVWDPVWSKDLLTDEARRKMREAGVGL